jgi:hypothetical protein
MYFICWEGATTSRGALCLPIALDINLPPSSLCRISAGPILPLHTKLGSESAADAESGHNISNSLRLSQPENRSALKDGVGVPFSSSIPWTTERQGRRGSVDLTSLSTTPVDSSLNPATTETTQYGELDGLVVHALERLSGLRYRPSLSSPMIMDESTSSFLSAGLQRSSSARLSSPSKHMQWSHRERSHQLLLDCSSWMHLQDTLESRKNFEEHFPVVSLVLEMDMIVKEAKEKTTSGGLFSSALSFSRKNGTITKSRKIQQYVLSLRHHVVKNGPTSPFQQVLSWLSTNQQDYFTAASVALDLLHDADTLLHLWKYSDEKIDQDEEQTKLEGLLDGIAPISYIGTAEESNSQSCDLQTSTLTQLADMAVWCLAKGGFPMSKTLEKFLSRNSHYNPARACLMLAATASSAMSEDPDAVAEVMGKHRVGLSTTHAVSEVRDLVWPVRCLLQIGVARDYLPSALLLLNVAIPDELRRRTGPYVAEDSLTSSKSILPSMVLCRELATLIVGSAANAPRLLLDLIDDQTRCRFWDSLEHETKLVVSLIEIDASHTFPLVRHTEVRDWAREEMHSCLKDIDSSDGESIMTLPSSWLEKLCLACLQNAGCDLRDLTLDSSRTSFGQIERTHSSSSLAAFDDRLEEHKQILLGTRNALMEPSFREASSFLDFDLLIPCLLLLANRGAAWHVGNFVPTPILLDAVCYLAGRPSKRKDFEPEFVFDGATAMEQCVLSGNVRAGGQLVGGTNGFVLSCCDILMRELGISMEESETVMLQEKTPVEIIESLRTRQGQPKTAGPFVLGNVYRDVLWLLDEHVLSVRTYGQFETFHRRGRVDPVFASRCLFRAWLCLVMVSPTEQRIGTAWLVAWLRQKLGMFHSNIDDADAVGLESSTSISTHRLVCSAMTRALSWSTTHHSQSDEITATTVATATSSKRGIAVSLATPDPLILANMLQMESKFLIQLAQSCCGLVESVPPVVAEEVLLRQAVGEEGGLSKSSPSPITPHHPTLLRPMSSRIRRLEDRVPSYSLTTTTVAQY